MFIVVLCWLSLTPSQIYLIFLSFTGEMIKIVVEDYVQHLSSYNYHLTFKPQLLFGEPFQYQNRIAIEFNHLYHWHPLMPDDFNINGTKYNLKEFVFHPEILVKHGIREFVDSLSKQRAGAVSYFQNFQFYRENTVKHFLFAWTLFLHKFARSWRC